MDVRLSVALAAGRITGTLSRRLGSGGTVLPGHLVARLAPDALQRIATRIDRGVALISGTNGKTTTARMVAQAAARAGLHPIANRSGANLPPGILAAAVAHTNLAGRPLGDIAILEVDEAHVPAIVRATEPRLLALTNIFRDQLDRYGEVDFIASTWRDGITHLDPSATLVLNADDPTVAQLAAGAPCEVATYGMEHRVLGSPTPSHDADMRLCPRCRRRLSYSWAYYGHVGHYCCGACGWQRVHPSYAVTHLELHSDGSTELTIERDVSTTRLSVPLPGLYNAYNGLAAYSIAASLGIPDGAIVAAIADFTAVFGRQEHVTVGDGSLTLALVKNPVGFNQVLQTLALTGPPDYIVIAINDLFADGTDVSWLWDVDFELLAEWPSTVLCTGLRAPDMALRLKYAGLPPARVSIEPGIAAAVEQALAAAHRGGRVIVLPTYTAMLEMRAALQRLGTVTPFWEN